MLAAVICQKIVESIVGASYFEFPSMALCRDLLELRCGMKETISFCDARMVGAIIEALITSEQFFASPVFVPAIWQIPPNDQRDLLLVQLFDGDLKRVRLAFQVHEYRRIHTDL